jgi:hypothetical protein
VFSYGTAINRITSQIEPIWDPSASPAQQLQAVNQAEEYLWVNGQWDGLIQDVTGLSTVNGILTLPSPYRYLTALRCESWGMDVPVKSQGYKFSPSRQRNGGDYNGYATGLASGWQNGLVANDLGDQWTYAGALIVRDYVTGQPYQVLIGDPSSGAPDAIGAEDTTLLYTGPYYIADSDNSGRVWQVIGGAGPVIGIVAAPAGSTATATVGLQSQVNQQIYNLIVQNGVLGDQPYTPSSTQYATSRTYKIPGECSIIDTLSFRGQAKLRYTYASDLGAGVLPDNFPALLAAVRAYHFLDVGDEARAQSHFQNALALLETDAVDIVEDEDMGSLSLDPMTSGGGLLNIV